MAIAYITEFREWPTQRNLVMAKWSTSVVEQTPVTFTTHAESAAFGANTRYIAFTADSIFSWTIGATPVATTSKMRFAAGTVYHIEVQPGDKISFVTNT